MKEKKYLDYIYYIIVGVVSFLVLTIFPLIGSTADIGWAFPNDEAGWTLFVVIRVLVASFNVITFYSFIHQGKLNIRNDENYKRAVEILHASKKRPYRPKSERKWLRQQWLTKGTTIFIGSLVSTVAITQAILMYDWISLISYVVTVIFGIVFGLLQMLKTQDYYTGEYLDYALLMQEKENEKCSKEMESSTEILKNK